MSVSHLVAKATALLLKSADLSIFAVSDYFEEVTGYAQAIV